jgi:hypothetical protein
MAVSKRKRWPLYQAASPRVFFATQIPLVSPFFCRCEHRRSDLTCFSLERTIISMVIKPKCLLAAVSRLTANMGNPETRWNRVRHTKCCRSSYNHAEWWADAAIKQILVDQVVPSVRVGDVGLTYVTNGGTTHAYNKVFSNDIPFTADCFGAWHAVCDDGCSSLGRPGG